MPIWSDDEHLPIRVTYHVGNVDEKEWRYYLDFEDDFIQGRMRQKGKTISIFDMSRAGSLTPRQREESANFMKKYRDEIPNLTHGTAFVAPNLIVRGLMMAVFWLQKYPTEYKIVKDFDAALDWCIKTLEQKGEEVPQTIREQGVKAFKDATHRR